MLVVGGGGNLPLCRAHVKVCIAKLEGDGAASKSLSAQPSPRHRGYVEHGRAHLVAGRKVMVERPLVRDGLYLLGHDTLCHAASLEARRALHQPGSRYAKRRAHLFGIRPCQVPKRVYAHGGKAPLGGRSHAAHGPRGKRSQKRSLGAREDNREPAWLVPLGCNLCDGLVDTKANGAAHSKRGNASLHATADLYGVLAREAPRGHIEEGLVDGDLLHEWSLCGEDVHDGSTHLAVAGEVPLRPDGVGAEPPGLRRWHGGVYAIAPCLVGCRRDHAAMIGGAANNHGQPAPLGVVELLDRRKERVEVEKANSWPVPFEDVVCSRCHAPIIG